MTSTHTLRWFACCLMLWGMPVFAAQAADAPAATSAEGRAAELYKRGTDAYRENKLAEAEKLYREAWGLQQTYDIATNLGAVALDLKKHRDAAEYLSFALRTFPARGKQEERDAIATRLSLAKGEVATLRLRVSADKADVLVNGRRVGVAPIAEEIFAAPGTVVVEARLDGYEPVKQTLELKRGDSREVALSLTPKEAPGGRSLVGPAIAFGAGGAGLVLGAVTAGLTLAAKDNLAAKCAPSGACDESLRDELDTALTLSRVSTVGFVVAGVGAAVGVTLVLLPPKSKPSPVAVQVGPGFVGVKGVF